MKTGRRRRRRNLARRRPHRWLPPWPESSAHFEFPGGLFLSRVITTFHRLFAAIVSLGRLADRHHVSAEPIANPMSRRAPALPDPKPRLPDPPIRHRPREDMVRLASPRPRGAAPGLPHIDDGSGPPPFRRTPFLLTAAELAFWRPLCQAVEGRYRVFCKVRLADVVRCPPGFRDERRWFQRIAHYHVDFVLCDLKTTAPILVIELDDSWHNEPNRQEIDAFKDEVLITAKLPSLRVPVQRAYEPRDLLRRIGKSIGMTH